MFKSSGRRLSQLPSCIARCCSCCYSNRDSESCREKLLVFPWSFLAMYSVFNVSHDRSLSVHSFDDNRNESKSMMTMITLMTRPNVSPKSIGIGIGIEENERNATMILLLLLNRLALRPAEKYDSHVDGDVWM